MGTSRANMLKLFRWLGLQSHVRSHGTIADIEQAIRRGHPVLISYQVLKYEEDYYAVVKGYPETMLHFSNTCQGKNFSLSKKEFIRRWKNRRLRKKYIGWMVKVAGK